MDHVTSNGAGEDGLAFHRCESFGDMIQSGLCDTEGDYAQILGRPVQQGARRKLPEALQDAGNYLYNQFVCGEQFGALCFLMLLFHDLNVISHHAEDFSCSVE